ncbi:hypothetical protein RGI99_002529 [Morganella morganii]|uniref:hypothetical protein n=1 Tax=Morganella morganii TaxID=582 RepID=UPI001A1D1DEC|nr:hypothetical protein [Morganella morganii]ELA7732459.1 hypothetical protein [Morganella morganii]ELA7777770.1 hypothetical protein [Morganella morganii]MBT0425966.1 hypothetical protein [Morganella morganii subsp. morganii]MBT0473717.1 hypothetical protein [Morganella morganii subsp. morganii]QWM01905.1 hypothetical protein IZ188_07540 [Morganella morganii subsp. morganii]
MKFEELPVNAQTAAFEAFREIAGRELLLTSGEPNEEQKARLNNLAESIALGFIKLYES